MNIQKIQSLKKSLSNRLRTLQAQMEARVKSDENNEFKRLQIEFDVLLKIDYDLAEALKP